MDILKIKARFRADSRKATRRATRNGGWIPAVYYGHRKQSRPIEIDDREFRAIVRAHKSAHLIDLALPGEEGDSVAIIKEVQRDVLKNHVYIHVDFQHVSMDEEITFECPLEIVGIPEGVKNDGGILNHPAHSITVACLPKFMPEKITVDVSALGVGMSIHLKDISVPNVTFKDSPEEVLASVTMPTKEDAPVAAVAAEGADAAAAPAAPAAAGDKKPDAKAGGDKEKEKK